FIYELIVMKRSRRNMLQKVYYDCSSEIFNQSAQFGVAAIAVLFLASGAFARTESEAGGEANLKLPDLSSVHFIGGIDGHKLLLWGILICVLGLLFGLTIYTRLKNLPVHRSMREIA